MQEKLTISFKNVAAIILDAKKPILASGLSLALLALVLSLFITPRFSSSVVTLPSEPVGSTYQSNFLREGPGLLDLFAGPSQINTVVLDALATINTDGFLLDFVRSNNIDRELFSEEWDAAAGKWKPRKSPIYRLKIWLEDLIYKQHGINAVTRKSGPTEEEILQRFRRAVNVEPDDELGIVEISVLSKDPQASARWANDLVKAVNEFLRIRKTKILKKRINVLLERLEAQGVESVRQSLSTEVARQMSMLAVTEVTDDYALSVLDEARVNQSATYPNRTLIFVGGLLLGLVFACLYTVYVRVFKV